MKDNLNWLFSSEIRFCSLLIGLLEMAWSFAGLAPAPQQSLFASLIIASDLGPAWFIVMFLVGALTSAGAILPWRSGRHIGLFLSTLIWFVNYGLFVEHIPMAPVVMSMPLLGGFSLLMMYADAKRKPRKRDGTP